MVFHFHSTRASFPYFSFPQVAEHVRKYAHHLSPLWTCMVLLRSQDTPCVPCNLWRKAGSDLVPPVPGCYPDRSVSGGKREEGITLHFPRSVYTRTSIPVPLFLNRTVSRGYFHPPHSFRLFIPAPTFELGMRCVMCCFHPVACQEMTHETTGNLA